MLFWAFAISLFAATPSFSETLNAVDSEIDSLIQSTSSFTFSERIEKTSAAFVQRPYIAGGLGEGENATYDQDPLYRTDGFDCTTFVETVISIAESKNLDEFKKRMNQIRYKNGQVDYVDRNHFVEIDWNPNNESEGLVDDITLSLAWRWQRYNQTQWFDKSLWYQGKKIEEIKLSTLRSESEVAALYEQLKQEGKKFSAQSNRLTIIKRASVRSILLATPAPAVINIVRHLATPPAGMPNIMVTHQVLLVEKEGQLRIRQATSRSPLVQVVDFSVDEFLATPIVNGENFIGINVLRINDLRR